MEPTLKSVITSKECVSAFPTLPSRTAIGVRTASMVIPHWGLSVGLASARLLGTTVSAPPASWKVMAFQHAMHVPPATRAGSVNSAWMDIMVTLLCQ